MTRAEFVGGPMCGSTAPIAPDAAPATLPLLTAGGQYVITLSETAAGNVRYDWDPVPVRGDV